MLSEFVCAPTCNPGMDDHWKSIHLPRCCMTCSAERSKLPLQSCEPYSPFGTRPALTSHSSFQATPHRSFIEPDLRRERKVRQRSNSQSADRAAGRPHVANGWSLRFATGLPSTESAPDDLWRLRRNIG